MKKLLGLALGKSAGKIWKSHAWLGAGWQIYIDATKYGPDSYHDSGELLTITTENAKLVHQTISALLAQLPKP